MFLCVLYCCCWARVARPTTDDARRRRRQNKHSPLSLSLSVPPTPPTPSSSNKTKNKTSLALDFLKFSKEVSPADQAFYRYGA
jgi:hypothetical protein